LPSVSEPRTVADAARVFSEARRAGQTVSIEREGGDIVLSTGGLDRVLEHEAGDLTVTVEAGIRLAALNERLGERVCIAVSGSVGPDALLAHLAREGLSKYDMPEYFVRLAEFPLTASGKILKRELVEMVKRGQLMPEPVRFVVS